MKIPVVKTIQTDAKFATDIVGSMEIDDTVSRQMVAAFLSGQKCMLDAVILVSGGVGILKHLAIRIEGAPVEPKRESPKIALTIEPIGCEPRLKVGDVVKAEGSVGVVVGSRSCEGTVNQYEILFRDDCLKFAGWKITEIDEVVSLGPFHEKES